MKNTIEMKRAIFDILNEINEILGCESYFCRPYCSQDKGQVENRNIDNFSLRSDLISDEEIAIVEATINNRPMKRLGWKTPHDVMIEECSY